MMVPCSLRAGTLCVLFVVSAVQAQNANSTATQSIHEWANGFARADSVVVGWRVRMETLDSDRKPLGLRIVESWKTTFRWPDCFLYRRDFVDIETDGTIAPEWLDKYRRGAGFGVNESRVLTPEGRMVRLSDTNGVWFEDDTNHGELRSRAMEMAEASPFLIARWFLDVGQRSQGWSLTEGENHVLHAEFPAHRCAFELKRIAGQSLVLIKLEHWHPGQRSYPTVWTFGDWATVAPELPVVPRTRTLWVYDRDTGALGEGRVDRLITTSVVSPPPDEFFRLDLSKVRAVDSKTGEIRDAKGNIRGKVRVPERVSRAGQWSILFGSLAAGLAVAGGLLWWGRRRAV